MTRGVEHAVASLDALYPGTHLCAFHRGPGQLTRIASTFIGHGLAAGDQLLYVTSDEHAQAVLDAMPGLVRADDAIRAGQLLIRSFAEAYGSRRPDDLGTVADGFRAAAAQSRKDGFRGLRVAAQMDDLAPLLGSPQEVVAWERMSTALQREIGVSSVCLYDRDLIKAEHADLIAGEHETRQLCAPKSHGGCARRVGVSNRDTARFPRRSTSTSSTSASPTWAASRGSGPSRRACRRVVR